MCHPEALVISEIELTGPFWDVNLRLGGRREEYTDQLTIVKAPKAALTPSPES